MTPLNLNEWREAVREILNNSVNEFMWYKDHERDIEPPAAIEAATVKLVEGELETLWKSLPSHRHQLDAAEAYELFNQRVAKLKEMEGFTKRDD